MAAALSAITCIFHCFVTVKRVLWCLWDWVLVVLWAAQTGVFGVAFIRGGVEKVKFIDSTTSADRMRAAVWVSLVNMLLWFASTILGMVWCCTNRRITRKTDELNLEEVSKDSASLELEDMSNETERRDDDGREEERIDDNREQEMSLDLRRNCSSEPPKYSRYTL